MSDSRKPRFRFEVRAPANGRVRQADVFVFDGEGRLLCTDRGDLMSQDQMTRLATRLAERLEVKLEAILSALQARWTETVEQRLQQPEAAEGSNEGPQNPSPVEILLELAEVADYFRGSDGRPYATVPVDEEGTRQLTVCVRAEGFKDWLRRRYYLATGRAPSGDALQSALGVLSARANYDGPLHSVHVRVAGTLGNVAPGGPGGGPIYLDLDDDQRRCVEVNASGWRILDKSPVRFRRPHGQRALPEPVRRGSVEELRPLVNVHDDEWLLLLAWVGQALCPQGPYPLLCLHGEQGAAKSSTARVLKSLVDPAVPLLRTAPRDERDLAIGANNVWVLALDNLSHLAPWLSDSLCRLATGGGLATRALYTDEEECLFDVQRPVILTGIEDLAERPDVLDRSIVLTLEPIDRKNRLPERVYLARVAAVLPRVLGAMLDGLSGALRLLPVVTAELKELPRMADFALWGEAFGRALGWKPGEFLSAYEANRADNAGKAIDSSILTGPLCTILEQKGFAWEGTCGDLLRELTTLAGDAARQKPWPNTPRALSGLLRRLAPVLRSQGILIELDIKDGRGRGRRRLLRISRPEAAGGPAIPSPPAPPSNRETTTTEQPWSAPSDGDGRFAEPSPPSAVAGSSWNAGDGGDGVAGGLVGEEKGADPLALLLPAWSRLWGVVPVPVGLLVRDLSHANNEETVDAYAAVCRAALLALTGGTSWPPDEPAIAAALGRCKDRCAAGWRLVQGENGGWTVSASAAEMIEPPGAR